MPRPSREAYKLLSSSYCSLHQPPATPSLLRPNILLSTLFSNTISPPLPVQNKTGKMTKKLLRYIIKPVQKRSISFSRRILLHGMSVFFFFKKKCFFAVDGMAWGSHGPSNALYCTLYAYPEFHGK